jgi:hypothetical protein
MKSEKQIKCTLLNLANFRPYFLKKTILNILCGKIILQHD